MQQAAWWMRMMLVITSSLGALDVVITQRYGRVEAHKVTQGHTRSRKAVMATLQGQTPHRSPWLLGQRVRVSHIVQPRVLGLSPV